MNGPPTVSSSPAVAARLYRRRLFLLSLVVLGCYLLVDPIEFVETRSIPYRFVYRVSGAPHREDYVRMPVQHPLIHEGERQMLTKRVACIAGDFMSFDGKAHYCNGQQIDTINVRRLANGIELPVFDFSGPIPAGKLYLLGTATESFDSRYLGFFEQSDAVLVRGLF